MTNDQIDTILRLFIQHGCAVHAEVERIIRNGGHVGRYATPDGLKTELLKYLRSLATAPADPEAAEVDSLVQVLEKLDTWRAEEWNELLERRPAILALLRPMVRASAPVADERAGLNEWPDLEVVNRIVRSVCETEPADPDRPDSVCISVAELQAIIEVHITARDTVADEWKTNTEGRDPLVHAVASLAAAISLLERTPKAKKAAASDTMFARMLEDYRTALDNARAAQASAPVAGEAQPIGYCAVWGVRGSGVAIHRSRITDEQQARLAAKHWASLDSQGHMYVQAVYAAPQASEAVRDVLAELVRLQDAKDSKAHLPHPQRSNEWAEYRRLWPAAMEKARAALKTQADKDGGDCAKGAGDEREARHAHQVLKTEGDHATAIARLSALMDLNPEPGSADEAELELLALLIQSYEQKKFPLPIAILETHDSCPRCYSEWERDPITTPGGLMQRCSNSECEHMRWNRRAALPTPSVVKQSLTATQTGEKGESDEA